MSQPEGMSSNALFFSLKTDEEIETFLTGSNAQEEGIEEVIMEENEERNEATPEMAVATPQAVNNEMQNTKERPLLNRMFGKIEAGSIRGSIFNMAILSLGSGCLSLPKYIEKTSLIMAVIDVIITGAFCWWTLNLLSQVCDRHKVFLYNQLVNKIYGKRVSIAFECVVLIYLFGVLILYQVIIRTLLGEVVFNIGFYGEYTSNEDFLARSFWEYPYVKYPLTFSITLLIILPLCLVKDVSKLRIASLFGVVTLIGIILLLIVQCQPFFEYYWTHVYKADIPNTHLNLFTISKGFSSDLYFFQFSTTLYYAYVSHIGAIPIFRTLMNNEMRRVSKVISRTVLLDGVLFLLIVVCGYLTCPINTPALIIERDNIYQGPDIIMSIGRMALMVTILMKLPNNYSALRISLFQLIWKTPEITTVKYAINYIVTLTVLTLTCSIGLIYSEITGYVKLLGGFCSGIVGFLMPGLLYVKSNDHPRFHWKNVVTIFMTSVFTCIGLSSGIITILGIAHGKK